MRSPRQKGRAIIHTRSLLGMTAHAIDVECHVARGLPGTTIVGLPQGAVREARDRIKSALLATGFEYPDGNIIFNLAPADLAKSGTGFDLPMAISLLSATGQLPVSLADYEFVGELGLFGEIRKVTGAVTFAMAGSRAGRKVILPAANRAELAIASNLQAAMADNLLQLTDNLRQGKPMPVPAPLTKVAGNKVPGSKDPGRKDPGSKDTGSKDTADKDPADPNPSTATFTAHTVLGQQTAKRALQIAAAGGHHILMVGPPGTGKTMLARNFRSLLPPLNTEQALEVAAIYSAAGLTRSNYHLAPFRDPHHSASAPALIGGGNPPAPGEAALAHHGVLFLDELPHFKPAALNLLREPIETGQAVLARAQYKVTFPCRFQLLAAMNPCPAGRICREDACRCSHAQVQRYQSRISGPLLDRIDIQVRVPALAEHVLAKLATPTHSAEPADPATQRAQIEQVRRRQMARQQNTNANVPGHQLKEHMRAATVPQEFLQQAIRRHQLSARSFHKLWRIALTIADLADSTTITTEHLAEALTFRSLDWEKGVA